ncbi:MAG: hypothetical protein ACON5B_01120 [Myxococcota bacterium]
MSRGMAWLVWLGLVAAIFWAPETDPNVWDWIYRVASGQIAGENAWAVAHFSLMGLWPLLMLALFDEQLFDRPFPGLPFVLGSMMLGCYVLLPWLGMRVPPTTRPVQSTLGWVVGSTAWVMVFGALGTALIVWAMVSGGFDAWATRCQTEGFFFLMGLDFVAFWLVSLGEARHQAPTRGGRWWLTLLPFVGLVLYLRERA